MSITFTKQQAEALLACFGGEEAEVVVRETLTGLEAYFAEYPEEGCVDLGATEEEQS